MKSLLIGLLTLAGLGHAATQYAVQEIEAPDTGTVFVIGDEILNGRGQVLGWIRENGVGRQFIWDAERGSRVLELDQPGLRLARVRDVNDQGTLLCEVELDTGSRVPCTWNSEEQEVQLIDPPHPGEEVQAYALNNGGQVLLMSGDRQAPLFDIWDAENGPRPVDPKTPPWVVPEALNDLGQVLFQDDSWSPQTTLIWQEGVPMRRIYAPKGHLARCLALNNGGDVLGIVGKDDAALFWMVWTHGGRQIKLQSSAKVDLIALNDRLELVGRKADRAIFWSQSTGWVDLNDRIDRATGWILQDAIAINETGQILAIAHTATDRDSQTLILLTPTQPMAKPSPQSA